MKTFQFVPWLGLVLGLTSLALIWALGAEPATALTEEDGVVEILSALFYLVGIGLGLKAAATSPRRFLPVFWVLLCVFFLGEETSWFQRYIGYSVKPVEELSAQKEFNFHNLTIFQGGKLADAASGFDVGLLFKAQNLFRLGFFGYFLVLPLVAAVPGLKRLLALVGYARPPAAFTLTVLAVFAVSFALALLAPSAAVKSALAETREMLYAFFIMAYVGVYLPWRSAPVP